MLLALCLGLIACGRNDEKAPAADPSERFFRLMNTGKNYMDQGQAAEAIKVYQEAVDIAPADPDARLNLANAHLLAGNAEQAITQADQVLALDHNSAAAHFVKGSALLRLRRYEEALKSLQQARNLDPSEPAAAFQAGLAHFHLQHWDEAIAAFQETLAFEPSHPSAHFQLGQALLRAGRPEEAQAELEAHQQIAAQNPGRQLGPAAFEKSKFTEPRVPFRLEQPAREGIAVRFTDQTEAAFGGSATNYSGPIAVLDPNHTGWNSLFVLDPAEGFRLLWNSNGTFRAAIEAYPHNPDANYTKMLVGDLQNDRFEDVIVLGDQGAHVFRFATNGFAMDVGPFSRLQNLNAIDGALVDLDFTGKLDLVAVTGGETNSLRLFRQFGPTLFTDITSTSGIPRLTNVTSVLVDDWPTDEMMDIIAGRRGEPPLLLVKERGGLLHPTNMPAWPPGSVIASGDFNNDLRIDLAIVSGGRIEIVFQGIEEKTSIPLNLEEVRQIQAVDYDNDGWLDLWAIGNGLQAWRNLGQAGFQDQTGTLGLDQITGSFTSAKFADFDMDCDSDVVLVTENKGLRFLRNDGGDANHQLKLRLLGNRSNASGLGVQVEVTAGGLRLVRTVQSLPVEIGVGKNQTLDSVTTHWFNLAMPMMGVEAVCQEPLIAFEMVLPEGSCPYVYVWDGEKYRFITDVLGAAPLGLPVAEGILIAPDPDEFVWIGGEETFVPRGGTYEVQITEELREILYLDEAKLAVVDYQPGTEVHPVDKLVPRPPFPPSTLMTVRNERPLKSAVTLAGGEVTERLREVDGQRVSPARLRVPQLRGLAEPHGVILDFGPLETAKPLVLVLNGWLRFGGGMANINASHHPKLPFPFPTLEAEIAPGEWTPVDVVAGAPAGKTKTIVIDLTGKLPPNARRLRLRTAFEIHWDRIALLEKVEQPATKLTLLAADEADLHWRGFSEFQDLPWDWPLTPDYEKVYQTPYWRITPAGWCTRYGDIRELIARRDEGLALLNGGDELTLRFHSNSLPPKPPGLKRQFFLYLDGWDKDSDFHVVNGTTVEPLPWHGMDAQRYGEQPRPPFPSDALHEEYNTRWVGARTLQRVAEAR